MRILLRFLSAALGLAIAAAGGLLALEVGGQWWRPHDAPVLVPWPAWRVRLGEVSWQAGEVRLIAGIALATGVILMLVALAARRTAIPLRDPATEVSVTTSPRSIARVVGQRVRAENDVTGASVTATVRKVRVRATSRMRTENQLRPRLIAVVQDLLDDLPLQSRPKISVVVDSPKDRP